MLANYFVTALRTFKLYKQYFILNVLGLSISFAASILMALFAVYELSYDSQPEHSQWYRINTILEQDERVIPLTNFSLVDQVIQQSEGDTLAVLSWQAQRMFTLADKQVQLRQAFSATTNIIELAALQQLSGDLRQSLQTPHTLALSASEALRIFGDTKVVNNTLVVGNQVWRIGAVFADLPENTHFAFKSLQHFAKPISINSSNTNDVIYLKLMEGTNSRELSQQLTDGIKQLQTGSRQQDDWQLGLQAVADIHLHGSTSQFELKPNGNMSHVLICIALTAILLLIASVNFINMCIAQSGKRAQEVGIRKALGATQLQLFCQFILETVLLVIFAMLVALAIVEALLPWFNQLVERQLSLQYDTWLTVSLLVCVLLIGIGAGLYPAVFIAAFNAKKVLSGDFQYGATAIRVRHLLLLLQSVMSLCLMIAAFAIVAQLYFLQSMPVGYDKERRIEVLGATPQQLFRYDNQALMAQLSQIVGVKSVGVIDSDITLAAGSRTGARYQQHTVTMIPRIGTGYNIVDLLGLELLAGRDFSSQYGCDWYNRSANGQGRASVIISESLARQLGFHQPEQAIGKNISPEGQYIVVGVVADVVMGSARENSQALIFICGHSPRPDPRLLMVIDENFFSSINAQVQSILKAELTINDIQLSLLSENYRAIYRDDRRLLQLVLLFAGLAIMLTCLGVLGLASFSALRRQKELAIRKVLGASKLELINLLAYEFLLLIMLAIVLVLPIAYYLVEWWLAYFNQRIGHPWWGYLVAIVIVTLMTWLTVLITVSKVVSRAPARVLNSQ